MLIVAGLIHAHRFRALFALMCGVVVLNWAQRLLPDRQATLDPKQIVVSAWTHQLPLVAFGLGADAIKHLEAQAPADEANYHDGSRFVGQHGEGWFPSFELPQVEP